MTATLEDIKEQQAKINSMIAEFQDRPSFRFVVEPPRLSGLERNVCAIISADGSRSYFLILLPGELGPSPWDMAAHWSATNGGALPDRAEAYLLFKYMRGVFKSEPYWTNEHPYYDYSLSQNFDNGYQDAQERSVILRARAVRRIPIPLTT